MPYIGTSPSNGVRRVHTYTATANQTTFTGSSTEGVTLTYADTNYIDVFQNGVLLGSADYTSTSGTSVVLAQGASADDLIVIVVYDVFSVADTVSKANGGTFDGNVTMAGTLDVTGAITSSAGATITTADNTAQLTLISTDADASSGPVLELYRNSSSPAADDVLGEIEFHGENDADEKIQYGLIAAKLQDASDGTEDVRLSFKTITAGTERERITIQPTETVFNEDSQDLDFRVESDANTHAFFLNGADGDIFINGAAFASGANRKQFEINSNATALRSGCSLTTTQFHEEFHNPNGTVGTISTNGSSTNFNTSSDYRLKENVTYIFDATSRLKQLKPSRFNFKADADTTVDGFLAHEVSSIVPEAVTGEKDAVDSDGNIVAQSIDQAKLVPLLVKTIQELEARITALENAE